MKPIYIFIFLVFSSLSIDAQQNLKTTRISLKKWEDSLKQYSTQIIEGKNPSDCFTADSIFTKILVTSELSNKSPKIKIYFISLFFIVGNTNFSKNSNW
jgi:hypothetical protein